MSSDIQNAIQIFVNGESRTVIPGITLTDLLRDLGLNVRRVAIERNLEIVPRSKWAEISVEQGDRYEIVQFVGGG